MYSIAIDRSRNLVEARLSGTMTVAEVHAYMDDLSAAMIRDRIRDGYGIVIDAGACTIQTQEMVRAMGQRMVAMPKAGAIAIVSASALARLQIKRMFVQDYARVAMTAAAARAWVLHGTEPGDEDGEMRGMAASA